MSNTSSHGIQLAEPVLNEHDFKELRHLEKQAEHPKPNILGIITNGDGADIKVAVKKLRVHAMKDGKFQKRLAKELYIWSKLNHHCILPLEGFFVEDNCCPSLVLKWMKNGDALDYLVANPGADLLSLVTKVAEAILYLHTNNIVHSDIKPDNILISNSEEPLLYDFGVSRMLTDPKSMQFTLLTKQPPYHEKATAAQVMMAIIQGSLPTIPAKIEQGSSRDYYMWRMCEFCWAVPQERGSIKSQLEFLKTMEAEFNVDLPASNTLARKSWSISPHLGVFILWN
ncbi:kinase-like protein [Fomitiporia mediterranea MF3/22]|uniref:kinase-like protein n=1 Tax=Fomitiporia mediterranea (strain MF3/22) TaxID=694068 RepID=UPI0004408BE7|nr:kinase-like protein [Fomitiporia mediterranea MF3/22]EJD07269.1 kinase-like protein [Fomitiporia mediterranea MF3/22]